MTQWEWSVGGVVYLAIGLALLMRARAWWHLAVLLAWPAVFLCEFFRWVAHRHWQNAKRAQAAYERRQRWESEDWP